MITVPSSKDDPFRLGEIVYVARYPSTPAAPPAPAILDDMNESSEEYQRELAAYGKTLLKYNRENFWLGKILQIRASAPEKVLVLVAWLYWAYELPKGYHQPWFSETEVFPSNLMNIIEATTVSDRANIVYLDEREDKALYDGVEQTFQRSLAAAREEQERQGRKVQADDAPPILFWRQRFDAEAQGKNAKLKYADTMSPLRIFCRCHKPNNPDKKMFQCAKCHQWNHEECVADDIGVTASKELLAGNIDEWAKENVPKSTHSTLTEKLGKGLQVVGEFIASEVEQIAGSGLEAIKHETTTEWHPVTPTNGNGDSHHAASSPTGSTSKKRGRPRKDSPAPLTTWKLKLGVSIIVKEDRTQDMPPFARITEKRGQKRRWDVRIHCLNCGETMD